jgi:ABC-type dipeptide/oligopeptide/nickel transport system permease component
MVSDLIAGLFIFTFMFLIVVLCLALLVGIPLIVTTELRKHWRGYD